MSHDQKDTTHSPSDRSRAVEGEGGIAWLGRKKSSTPDTDQTAGLYDVVAVAVP